MPLIDLYEVPSSPELSPPPCPVKRLCGVMRAPSPPSPPPPPLSPPPSAPAAAAAAVADVASLICE